MKKNIYMRLKKKPNKIVIVNKEKLETEIVQNLY